MMKKILFTVGLMMSFAVSAAETVETRQDVSAEETIIKLFDAMRAGDGAAIHAIFLPDANLDRVRATGEYRKSSFTPWADWVDEQADGDADEQIFSVRSQEFGNLAYVWAPFKVVYKGELVGCGVNHFTLIKQDGDWRIAHGIDTNFDGDCNSFGPDNL